MFSRKNTKKKAAEMHAASDAQRNALNDRLDDTHRRLENALERLKVGANKAVERIAERKLKAVR